MSGNIKLTPDMVPGSSTHPGVLLKEELEFRKIKQVAFAKLIDIAANVLSEIINGKRNITPAIALKLESALNIDAEYWMRLQIRFEIDTIRIKHKNALKRINLSSKRRKSLEKAITPR